MVSRARGSSVSLIELDEATQSLVNLAARLAGGAEHEVRAALQVAYARTPHEWIEEVLLQTYLFAGFPRALNGMREWRRLAPQPSATRATPSDTRSAGEATCAQVYGEMYEKLRVNIRQLHPLLDDWMIEEGYGKVLSRQGLDLGRRELCIVAACVASGQDRQLQSHLHGARNVGVPSAVIRASLESLRESVDTGLLQRALKLWARIDNDVH